MRTLATCALLCGLLVFAACGEGSKDSNETKNGTNPPADTPTPVTETVVLDVQGMT